MSQQRISGYTCIIHRNILNKVGTTSCLMLRVMGKSCMCPWILQRICIASQSQVSMHSFPLLGKLALQKGLLAANGNLAFSHCLQVTRLQKDPPGYLAASLSTGNSSAEGLMEHQVPLDYISVPLVIRLQKSLRAKITQFKGMDRRAHCACLMAT